MMNFDGIFLIKFFRHYSRYINSTPSLPLRVTLSPI